MEGIPISIYTLRVTTPTFTLLLNLKGLWPG